MLKRFVYIVCFLSFCSPSFASNLKDYEFADPKKLPDFNFVDKNKDVVSLNDFSGKVVVLNFWATWCRPCVAEMPSLDKMARSLEGRNIVVIPLSVDYKGVDVIKEFYNQNKINNLNIYSDERGRSFKSFNLKALPTTIIINKEGSEVARVLGEIEWNSSEVKEYLRELSFQQ